MKQTLLIGLIISTLSAGDIKHSSSYQRCLDNAMTTYAMVECNNQEWQYQEGLLSRYYKEAMHSLSYNKKIKLRNVERLWIKYRDANCGFFANLTGGSIDRVNASACMADMTAMRVSELKQIVEN